VVCLQVVTGTSSSHWGLAVWFADEFVDLLGDLIEFVLEEELLSVQLGDDGLLVVDLLR